MNGYQESPMLDDAQNVNPTILINRKKCPKCGEARKFDKFPKNKARPDGIQPYCNLCYKEVQFLYRMKNVESIRKQRRDYRQANKEKILQINRDWRKKNPDKVKAMLFRGNAKRLSTHKGRLSSRISWAIWNSLKSGKCGKGWKLLVDFTLLQLMKHLEKQFLPGMTWNNYGKWHIDHKVPLSVFNFKNPNDLDFKRAWALKNLQPLWSTDNIRKGAKLKKPFQLSINF